MVGFRDYKEPHKLCDSGQAAPGRWLPDGRDYISTAQGLCHVGCTFGGEAAGGGGSLVHDGFPGLKHAFCPEPFFPERL